MIRNLDWNKVEARAKEMKESDLIFAYFDCLDCIKKAVENEGYYYDEASVYRAEIKSRGILIDKQEKLRRLR